MKLRKRPVLRRFDEEFLEQDFDPYSENFDEDEAMERGWKASEIGFWRGFRGS